MSKLIIEINDVPVDQLAAVFNALSGTIKELEAPAQIKSETAPQPEPAQPKRGRGRPRKEASRPRATEVASEETKKESKEQSKQVEEARVPEAKKEFINVDELRKLAIDTSNNLQKSGMDKNEARRAVSDVIRRHGFNEVGETGEDDREAIAEDIRRLLSE